MRRHTEPDENFARFWARFPRRVSKQDAWKAWTQLQPTPALVDTMLNALTWQCRQPGWLKDGGLYVPYPASWLRGRRWEDEPFHAPAIGRRRLVPDDEPL
jgi:hypothetical protein